MWGAPRARMLRIFRVRKALGARSLRILRGLRPLGGFRSQNPMYFTSPEGLRGQIPTYFTRVGALGEAGARDKPTGCGLGLRVLFLGDEPPEQALPRPGHASSGLGHRPSSVPRTCMGRLARTLGQAPRASDDATPVACSLGCSRGRGRSSQMAPPLHKVERGGGIS